MAARWFLVLALLALGAGCGEANGTLAQPASGGLPPVDESVRGMLAGRYIKHVIVIIQENRSFENFFAGFPGANAPMWGYALHDGKTVKVKLHETTFETNPNLEHNWSAAIDGWNDGKMNGFHTGPGSNYAAYAYVLRSQVAPYWDMADQFVLADDMFPTEFGGSYTAHLTLVAGTDNTAKLKAQVNFPTAFPDDCDSPPGTRSSLVAATPYRKVGRGNGPFPCFTQFNTMARVLDGAGISWKYYSAKKLDAGFWEPFEAIKYVRYGDDWKNIAAPQTKVLTDIRNGDLASVSWVSPSHEDSDHPGAHSDLGPSWVASVVNAIGQSSYWNESAIVVLWDDWGGWYDNAPPPQLDFRGLGERVPCLIISPYAEVGSGSNGGYVDRTQYEFGSILKFMRQVFSLPAIGPESAGYTDSRATSILNAFDFTQSPRPFTPFGSKYPASRFLHEPPSNEPVDTE